MGDAQIFEHNVSDPSDRSGMDVPSVKECNESGGSNEEGGNTDVFNKIRSLFENEIYESLQSKS